ncbi:hypothetical protein [Nonomuraea sp. bgisy094]
MAHPAQSTVDPARGRRTSGTIGRTTALIGGPVFLLGTALHPARDGQSVAAVGQLYGLTHDLQALGLVLQAVSLVGILASRVVTLGRRGPLGWYAAILGTLTWFGVIVFDGSHNPAVARYAPEIVHTPADLGAGGALLVLPALLLFPLGYAVLGVLLGRHGRGWPGLLLGLGAIVYTVGGLVVFVAGPHSPLIQSLEVVGAALYAAGYIALAWTVRGMT